MGSRGNVYFPTSSRSPAAQCPSKGIFSGEIPQLWLPREVILLSDIKVVFRFSQIHGEEEESFDLSQDSTCWFPETVISLLFSWFQAADLNIFVLGVFVHKEFTCYCPNHGIY